MVNGPVPGMLKLIVCGPVVAAALVMAWRRLPAPVSLVFVTVKVAAKALLMLKNTTESLVKIFLTFLMVRLCMKN